MSGAECWRMRVKQEEEMMMMIIRIMRMIRMRKIMGMTMRTMVRIGKDHREGKMKDLRKSPAQIKCKVTSKEEEGKLQRNKGKE